jgi:hypothetical protein
MFVLCSSTLDIPTKLMKQKKTMHIETLSGFTPSFVKLNFQTQFLHHITHIEEPP